MECTIVVRHTTCMEDQTPSLAALLSLPTDKVSKPPHLRSIMPLMASIYRVFMIITCNLCTFDDHAEHRDGILLSCRSFSSTSSGPTSSFCFSMLMMALKSCPPGTDLSTVAFFSSATSGREVLWPAWHAQQSGRCMLSYTSHMRECSAHRQSLSAGEVVTCSCVSQAHTCNGSRCRSLRSCLQAQLVAPALAAFRQ